MWVLLWVGVRLWLRNLKQVSITMSGCKTVIKKPDTIMWVLLWVDVRLIKKSEAIMWVLLWVGVRLWLRNLKQVSTTMSGCKTVIKKSETIMWVLLWVDARLWLRNLKQLCEYYYEWVLDSDQETWNNYVSTTMSGCKLQWNFDQNMNNSIHENAYENVICETVAILSRGRWVKDGFRWISYFATALGY